MIATQSCRGLLAAAGMMLALGPATAAPTVADDNLALTVVAFVHSIDASPDWSARMRGLTTDEAGQTIEIDSLVIGAEGGGLVVEIENATLSGYTATDDGGLTAASLTIGKASIATSTTTAVLSDIRFDDVEVPAHGGIGYDRIRPFSSLIGAYSVLAKSQVSGGRIAAIDVQETNQGNTSAINYRNVEFGALAGGNLDRISAGPLGVQSPAADPLAEFSVARAEAKGIDLDAFLHVYDPLRYVAGIGDAGWQPAVDGARYVDLALKMPGIQLTIGALGIEGLKVRQPAESFAPLIDAMTSDRRRPELTMKQLRSRYLGKLLSTFGVARFFLDDVAVVATGIDQLTLGAFELTDASSDRLGEIAILDFVAAIAGQGAFQVGGLALGGVVPPPFEAFDEALKVAQNGGDVDVSSLAPKLSSVEAAGIHMQAIDFAGLALGKLQAHFDNHVGTVPTAITINIDDLDVAAASLPSASLRSLVAGLGYDRIDADADLSLNWREADGTVSLDPFELDIADFGNTTADVVLAGLTREAIEQAGEATVLDDLRLERARVTFSDRSLVDRSLSMRAELLKVPLDRLKQQLSGALPLMLAVLGDQAKAMVPVLQNFIKTPGTLTIESAPKTPVPISEIENAARTRPQSLPGLLAVSVSGTPGGGTAEANAPPDSAEADAEESASAPDAPALVREAPGAAEGANATPR